MSLERNSRERSHWTSVEQELRAVRALLKQVRNCLVGVLIVLTALLILLRFANGRAPIPPPDPTCPPSQTPTNVAATAPPTPTSTPWDPTPRMTTLCFITNASFAPGEPETGATNDAANESHSWEFRSRDKTVNGEGATLEEYIQSRPPGSFGVIAIYGGHDAAPLKRPNKHHLDSNFDLAHRRALSVQRLLKGLVGRYPWLLLHVAGSSPPSDCGDKDDKGATSSDPLAPERRSPVLAVTTWEPAR